jgi:threonine dehydrogenase-like Zn-dependent dehydrogenase
MHAVFLEKPGQFIVRDVKNPRAPAQQEALVRVRKVGVCGTDLHAFHGRHPFVGYPRILGHELGAEVLEIGENNRGIQPGDRCAIEPYMNCGSCIACQRGKTNCCAVLKVLGIHVDGGMQERLVVPIRNLHKSNTLTFEELALVETLGIGAHAVRRADLQPDDTVAIIGLGPIGLATLQFATRHTQYVAGVDLARHRVAFAKSRYPGLLTVDGSEELSQHLRDVFQGDLPTVVFDCTGSGKSMMGAFQHVAHGGKLIFVGLVPGQIAFEDPLLHGRELTVMGSRNATAEDLETVIRLMEHRDIQVSSWVTHRASARVASNAFAEWMDPSSHIVKGVFDI